MQTRWLELKNKPKRWLVTCAASALAAILFWGCVTNPITGQSQFSFVGRSELLNLSRQAVPAQFSADYGVINDVALNNYVSLVGRKLVATLKPSDVVYPDMPFSFQVVNAAYINAYAFPDGTIAVTRGMMAELRNEAQLAAVLGHEIAHVNCGHTAAAISRGTIYDLLTQGTAGYLASKGSAWADLAGAAGQLGGAVALANYSREQERQADQGGMEYMVRAGYDPQGMIELMQLLVRISGTTPSALEQMFASHPMSTERLQTAQERLRTHYAGVNRGENGMAAYQNATASLRADTPAIQQFEVAARELARQQPVAAMRAAQQGLRSKPNDYTGLLLLAQAEQMAGNQDAAYRAATQAMRTQPNGARARSILAQSALQKGDYTQAIAHLNSFEQMVPGEPRTAFFKGLAYEGAGNRSEATREYAAFVRKTGQTSREGRHAAQRLQQYASAESTGPTRQIKSKPKANPLRGGRR